MSLPNQPQPHQEGWGPRAALVIAGMAGMAGLSGLAAWFFRRQARSKALQSGSEQSRGEELERKPRTPALTVDTLMRCVRMGLDSMTARRIVQDNVATLHKRLTRDSGSDVKHLVSGGSPQANRLRLELAQFLTLYHSIAARQRPEDGTLYQQCHRDMDLAWELLHDISRSPDAETTLVDEAALLSLDVAQRLQSPTKMLAVFTRLIGKLEQGIVLPDDQLVVAFTTAPLLGRWRDTRRLGDLVIRRFGSLDEFHVTAEQQPELPDYEVLYRLAESECKAAEFTPLTFMSWTPSAFHTLSIKLQAIDCPDQRKRKALLGAFPDGDEWQDVPDARDMRVLRFGAIAHCHGLSTRPANMVGPANQTRMVLEGYRSVLLQGTLPAIQTERLTLSSAPNDPQQWKGTYSLSHTPQGEEASITTLSFDVMATLHDVPQAKTAPE